MHLIIFCMWCATHCVDNNVGILPTTQMGNILFCASRIFCLFAWKWIYETFCACFDCLRFITLSLNEIVLCALSSVGSAESAVYHLQKHISNWIFYIKVLFLPFFAPKKTGNNTNLVFLFSSEEIYNFMCFFVKCLHLQLCASVTAARHYYCHRISFFVRLIRIVVENRLFVSFAIYFYKCNVHCASLVSLHVRGAPVFSFQIEHHKEGEEGINTHSKTQPDE